MGRNAFLQLLLLFLIVLDSYNASFGWEHRKLAASDPNKNKAPVRDTPSPTPVPGEKNPDPKLNSETKNNEAVSPAAIPPVAKMGHETPDPNGSNSNNPTAASPTPETKRNDEKGHEKEKENGEGKSNKKEKKDEGKSNGKKNEGKTIQQSNTDKSCDGLRICNDKSKMVGCILQTGSTVLVVLVQNGEERTIKVNISSMESHIGVAEVAKNQTAMINITLSGNTNVTLNAGHGDCGLQIGTPIPEGKFFMRLPSYEQLVTPVNGAYFLIISVIVFGGTWACCQCRKKKRHDGNQYQELEMALPESGTNVQTADGWDQGWDDDWDEDMAVKSPGKHVGSISANGLTSRSSNKDGWENNLDD
ncbi:hypothetical protein L6164_000046 [Bauhinia variegata]|uniref:Uncharacterized protein n=1 Tax=Bauhinia variegata TaxID=167791 RepID=A0ACB9Q4R1_BAUVA|nr:hypothetical protein L6164_000046 [Bauhinia variegata]